MKRTESMIVCLFMLAVVLSFGVVPGCRRSGEVPKPREQIPPQPKAVAGAPPPAVPATRPSKASAPSAEAVQHYQKGLELKKAKDYEGAAAELSKATQLAPDYADAHAALGWAYLAQKEKDKAIGEFQEVVRLVPQGEKGSEAESALRRLGVGPRAAKEPEEPVTKAYRPKNAEVWSRSLRQFMKELYACIERCPDPTGQPPDGPLTTKLEILRDGKPVFRIYKGDVGRTPQAEINKLIGAGSFEWEGVVDRTQRSKKKPGYTIVYVPLPEIGKPPDGWEIDTKSIGFYIDNAQDRALRITKGSRIRFAGTLAKDPEDFAMSGVTAFHGVGTKLGVNFIQIQVDPNNVKVTEVVTAGGK